MRDSVRSAERWRGYVAFWLGAALTLIGVGLATLVAVDHGRRLAFFFVLLGAGCLAIAFLVRRARPYSDR